MAAGVLSLAEIEARLAGHAPQVISSALVRQHCAVAAVLRYALYHIAYTLLLHC